MTTRRNRTMSCQWAPVRGILHHHDTLTNRGTVAYRNTQAPRTLPHDLLELLAITTHYSIQTPSLPVLAIECDPMVYVFEGGCQRLLASSTCLFVESILLDLFQCAQGRSKQGHNTTVRKSRDLTRKDTVVSPSVLQKVRTSPVHIDTIKPAPSTWNVALPITSLCCVSLLSLSLFLTQF